MIYGNRPVGSQECVGSISVVDSDWLTLRRDRLVDQSGTHSYHWVVERSSFVLVVPLRIHDDHVALVSSFRYPVGQWFWEFPQSRVSEDSPASVEGVAAGLMLDLFGGPPGTALSVFGTFFEAYGYSDHRCYCVLAELPGEPTAREGQSSPPIHWVRRHDLLRFPLRSGIADGATLAALAILGNGS